MTPELSQSYQLTSILSIINLSNIHAEWKASKSSYLVKNKIQICLFTSKKKKKNKTVDQLGGCIAHSIKGLISCQVTINPNINSRYETFEIHNIISTPYYFSLENLVRFTAEGDLLRNLCDLS